MKYKIKILFLTCILFMPQYALSFMTDKVSQNYEQGGFLSFREMVNDAHNGDHSAQSLYCGLLVMGQQGVVRNLEEAARWCTKSAEGGDARGQFMLAALLRTGQGIEKNLIQAYFWANKATEQGLIEAKEYLLFIEGELSPDEFRRARDLVGKSTQN